MPALQNTTNAFSQQPAGKRAQAALAKAAKTSHKVRTEKTRRHAKENSTPTGDGARKKKSRRSRRGSTPVGPDPAVLEALQKERQQREDARGIGRMVARFIDAFADIRIAFHWGREREAGTTGLDEQQEASADLYDRIVDAYPDIKTLNDELGPKVVADQVAAGQAQARADDTFVLRSLVMQLRDWGINVTNLENKSVRGMQCEDMAMLLIPADVCIDEQPGLVLEFQQGDRALEPHTLPHLCFDDELTADPERMFLNTIPMKCARGVMHGGQSAIRPGRRAGNTTAKKYGIFTVTDELVGYILSLTRYAISSEPTFTFDGSNGFDYRLFYKTILDTMSSVRRSGPTGKAAMDNVIKEWNQYIFGASATTAAAVTDEERDRRAAEYKASLIALFTSADEDMRLTPDAEPEAQEPAQDDEPRNEPLPPRGRGEESSSSESGSGSSSSSESSNGSSDEDE